MPIMYPLRLETNRFADAAEVYDAVFLGKHRLDGSPLEYAANFSTALRTDFIHTPENRVIVSRDIADALAQVGPDAKRTDVILIDSDIETRKPRHGARVCHDFVAIQIPNLTDSLDYTRVTATPKTVHTTKPTPDPVLACDDDMPPLFYYGRRKLHASAAARQVFENAREVSVLAGYGRRRDEGRTQEMQKVLDTGEHCPTHLRAVKPAT